MAAAIVEKIAGYIGQGATGRRFAEELVRSGVTTRRQLKRADVLARLPTAARAMVLYNPVKRVPRTLAELIVKELLRRISFVVGGRHRRFRVIPVGSFRRGDDTIRDLDFLVVASVGDALANIVFRPPRVGDSLEIATTYAAGTRRRGIMLRYGSKYYKTDLFTTAPRTLPFALFHHTGSRDYSIRVRAHAKRNGLKLNQYGLFDAVTGDPAAGSSRIHTEADIARYLGITVRPPNDRGKYTGPRANKK